MKTSSFLKGLEIKPSASLPDVEKPLFSDEFRKVNGNEFFLNVPGVGRFYASGGKNILYSPEPGADPDWVNLYLSGQVLAAVMHQRKIINFHASSFALKEKGVMITGDTGAGKSSLTAAFTLNGSLLLSDDLTPVIFRNKTPFIMPAARPVKTDGNTAQQLGITPRELITAEKGTGKFYLHTRQPAKEEYPLNVIFALETGENKKPEFLTPRPADRFSLLRSAVCSWEILAGMPETEAGYLAQLINIVAKVSIVRVIRPEKIGIRIMHEALMEYISELT